MTLLSVGCFASRIMDESRAKKCCRLFLLEWHYSKLWFFHHDWRVFAYSPWLPYKWYFQLIYLAYRWIIALYFLGWLIYGGIDWGSPIYFIFFTNWSFILFNLYLIIAALSVTTKLTSVHLISRPDEEEFSHKFEIKTKSPAGCCGYSDNNISWYQMFHWLLYILANEMSFLIFLLFWALVYEGGPVGGVTANTHLVNAIVALADIWICGIPIYTLQLIYIWIFGTVYVIFTGIYFEVSNGNIVYSVLNYGENLGLAVGIIILSGLVVFPAVHFIIFYSQSKLKEVILYCIFKERRETMIGEDEVMEERESTF